MNKKEDNNTSPEKAIHDLILASLYLTRFTDNRVKSENQLFRTWKSYDWNALDKHSEEEFTIDQHGNKSLYLTEEGVAKAEEILDRLRPQLGEESIICHTKT